MKQWVLGKFHDCDVCTREDLCFKREHPQSAADVHEDFQDHVGDIWRLSKGSKGVWSKGAGRGGVPQGYYSLRKFKEPETGSQLPPPPPIASIRNHGGAQRLGSEDLVLPPFAEFRNVPPLHEQRRPWADLVLDIKGKARTKGNLQFGGARPDFE